jgi:hypothetical protein
MIVILGSCGRSNDVASTTGGETPKAEASLAPLEWSLPCSGVDLVDTVASIDSFEADPASAIDAVISAAISPYNSQAPKPGEWTADPSGDNSVWKVSSDGAPFGVFYLSQDGTTGGWAVSRFQVCDR